MELFFVFAARRSCSIPCVEWGDGMAIVDGDEFALRCSFVMSCAAGLFPSAKRAPCVRYDGFKDGQIPNEPIYRGHRTTNDSTVADALGSQFSFKNSA
jgi:hypothetical protein